MTYVLAAEGVSPPGRPAPGWVAIADGLIVEADPRVAPAFGFRPHELSGMPVERLVACAMDRLGTQMRRRGVVADLRRVALVMRREAELFERAMRAISEALGMDLVGVSEVTGDGEHFVLRGGKRP